MTSNKPTTQFIQPLENIPESKTNSAVQILNFLNFSQNLKKQQRTMKLSDERHESSADHSWHLAMMVLVVAPHLSKKPDILKILKMALIHDLVEAKIGDTPYGHSAQNKSIKHMKRINEEAEAKKIEKLLGKDLGTEFYQLWREYDNKQTYESKVLAALDSLEANYQSTLFDVSHWDNYFYKIALSKADKHCQNEAILHELNREITKRMEIEITSAGYDLDLIRSGYYDNDPLGDK